MGSCFLHASDQLASRGHQGYDLVLVPGTPAAVAWEALWFSRRELLQTFLGLVNSRDLRDVS